jgi:TRAP-type C4-dicarboxylate transport system permease small subunit
VGIIKKLDWCIDKFASSLLVVSLLSILFFSSLAIILRWFHINLYWVDPFVRHLVFLGTFLGGVVATGRGSHIGIDLISKFLELKHLDRARVYVHRTILVCSGLILIWMLKSGLDFTRVEMAFSKEEFWGIKSGFLVAIIPFGLALMMMRFFLLFILSFDKNGPELHSAGELP